MAIWTRLVAGDQLGTDDGNVEVTDGGDEMIANPNPWTVVGATPIVTSSGQLDFSNPANSGLDPVIE